VRPKPAAATILTWLRNNDMSLGALTSHDTAALLAATQIAELWIRGDYGNRKSSAVAFSNVVMQMQEGTRFLAFHAIAHVGDWCHRWELWQQAGLSKPIGPECKYGPRRREES
jgi:hypothetical protein